MILNPVPLWLRWAGILWGLIVLTWLPFEATSELGAVLLATGGCVYFAWVWAVRRMHASFWRCWYSIATGFVSGLTVAPLSLCLMFLKNGLHGHEVPEYTADQMLTAVGYLPVFTLSGLLVGIGLAFYCWAQKV